MQEPLRDITIDLVRCPKCGLQLDTGVPVCPNDGTRVLQTPEIGELFQNKYVFVERLAAGGMGVVYKAKQQGLDRFVAIKVMSIANATANSIRRFQQEAQALAMLHHPRLVQVFELGVTPYGQPYTVMEYVDGKGLDQVLAERKTVSLNKAINIFMQVCDGLIYVHDSGILHRDLKPSNIMLINPYDENPMVKLVDFGIAKMMDSNSQKGLTQTGEVMGSPQYMSPEQAKGLPVDVRSDIYSLGCVIYEALTGVAPFEGATVVEIILKQVSGKHRSVNSVVRGIKYPNIVEAIIDKMLEKDPEDRYSSAEELRADLAKLESENRIWYHLPITALQRSKQDPVVVFAVLTLTTLIAIGCGVAIWNIFSKQHEEHVSNYNADMTKEFLEKVGGGLNSTNGTAKAAKTNKQPVAVPALHDNSPPVASIYLDSNLPRERIAQTGDAKLDFQGFPLPPHAFRWFHERRNRYVTSIAADGQSLVDNDSIQYIKDFPLQELRLRETEVTHAIIPDIAKMQSLQTLELKKVKLTAADCKQLLALKQLTELKLEECDLTDEEARILLSGQRNLRKLDFAGNRKITNAVASLIVQYEPYLNYLDLGATGITDKSIQTLSGLQCLQELYVPFNYLTDKCLPALQHMPALRLLDIRFAGITDEGLSKFKADHIYGLRLGRHTKLTDPGLAAFTARYPSCLLALQD